LIIIDQQTALDIAGDPCHGRMRSRFCEVIVPLFQRHFAFTLLAIVMCGCLQAPADAILGITTAYNADEDNRKINLGVGAYRTEVNGYNGINAGLQCTA
jgi:hypothetical protein